MRKSAILVEAALGIMMMLGAREASATVIYSTGFESATYTTGTLKGQNGWYGTDLTGTVEDTTVFAGSQAVEYDASNATNLGGQNINYQDVSASGQGSSVQVTDEFYYSSADSSVIWQALATFGTGGFLGSLVVYNGDAYLNSTVPGSPSVAVTAGAWHTYAMDFNFATGMQSAFVDGTQIGTDAAFSSSTALTRVGIGINAVIYGTSPTSQGYVDNLSITSATPLPASLPLLASGLGFLGLLGWRTKRKASAAIAA